MPVATVPGARTAGWSSRLSSHVVFFLLCAAATVLTYQVHEGAHLVAGRLVGLQERYLFTGVQTLTQNPAPWQMLVKNTAGPLVTLVIALTCLVMWLKARRGADGRAVPDGAGTASVLLLAAALESAFLRIQPMARDLFRGSGAYQDEFKIAQAIGLPGQSLMAVSLAVFVAIYLVALVWGRRGRVGTVVASVAGAGCGAAFVNGVVARLV